MADATPLLPLVAGTRVRAIYDDIRAVRNTDVADKTNAMVTALRVPVDDAFRRNEKRRAPFGTRRRSIFQASKPD